MEATTLAAYGLTVTAKQTMPSKPGKVPRDVWEVSGLINGYEDLLYRLGGKKWRGAFSFWSDPTEALLDAVQKEERTSFAERIEGKKERAEDRAERYRECAANAEVRSEAAHDKFRALLDPIPLGQPILIGHHSEARHRKTLQRADNAMRKVCEESDKAKHYVSKAAGAARTASDKDATFAHRRLREAEAELRRMQRHLIAVGSHAQKSTRYTIYVREQEEKVAYWKQQIEASGAGQVKEDGLSERDAALKATINKSDYIYH